LHASRNASAVFRTTFGLMSSGATAAATLPLTQSSRGEKRRRVWGEHLRRRSQDSARHAQPGSILYAFRVDKMSLTRARLDPASGSGWFGFRAVIWPARETVMRARRKLQGRAAPGRTFRRRSAHPRLGKRYGGKAHSESPRTTKLYDRTADAITRDEVERIVI
jgi:hypothetical protein